MADESQLLYAPQSIGPILRGASRSRAIMVRLSIQGVEAHGQRITRTIAVGEAGNDPTIVTVEENWMAPSLGLELRQSSEDPRGPASGPANWSTSSLKSPTRLSSDLLRTTTSRRKSCTRLLASNSSFAHQWMPPGPWGQSHSRFGRESIRSATNLSVRARLPCQFHAKGFHRKEIVACGLYRGFQP